MSQQVICPFSKPIIGGWCQCEFANLEERCSGKMGCKKGTENLQQCYHLVDLLKEKSRFVLGLSDAQTELTHAQLMKIRCGGLRGMQRVLGFDDPVADIPWVLEQSIRKYASLEEFPYSEIMPDITGFSHRQRKGH